MWDVVDNLEDGRQVAAYSLEDGYMRWFVAAGGYTNEIIDNRVYWSDRIGNPDNYADDVAIGDQTLNYNDGRLYITNDWYGNQKAVAYTDDIPAGPQDTGWRDVKALVVGGDIANAYGGYNRVRVRRIGNTCYLSWADMSTGPAIEGGTALTMTIALGTGWTSQVRMAQLGNYSSVTDPTITHGANVCGIEAGSSTLTVSMKAGGYADKQGNLVWVTDDPFPTVLPGQAV